MKTKERKELLVELNTKRSNLEELEARMSGGYSKAMKRNYMKLDKELAKMTRDARLMELEIMNNKPVNPHFEYEKLDEYQTLRRAEGREQIENLKEIIEKVKQQKVDISRQIPEFKARINEIEKSLKMELTKFDEEEKSDYIG